MQSRIKIFRMIGNFENAGGIFALPTTTTLDPSNTAPAITLSGGNLVATANTTTSGAISRSIASHGSGKYYFEMTITTLVGSRGSVGLGFLNASQSIANNNFIGQSSNSVGYYGNGAIYINNAQVLTGLDVFVQGSNIAVAFDIGNQLIWVRLNGGSGWNASGTANPATGTGGQSTSTVGAGPYYAGVDAETSGNVVTANFGATAYTQTPPAGFGNL